MKIVVDQGNQPVTIEDLKLGDCFVLRRYWHNNRPEVWMKTDDGATRLWNGKTADFTDCSLELIKVDATLHVTAAKD